MQGGRPMSFSFFLFDGDHFLTFVITAVWANPVRDVQIVTVGTFRQILRLEREMAAAAVTASLGSFPFWERWHDAPCASSG